MVGACLMLVIASSLGMFQIITRFVLEQPAEWTEILIRLSLIWMVFLGIPAAFRQGVGPGEGSDSLLVGAGVARRSSAGSALLPGSRGSLATLGEQGC